MNAADAIISELELAPHPEGGHYREVYRAALRVGVPSRESDRSAATAIYFLLKTGEVSRFHRVRSDEAWHHYAGNGVELWCLDAAGARCFRVGPRLAEGERPFAIVPAGTLQAARPLPGEQGFALAGCTVSPGFEFSDFEMPSRTELVSEYPAHAALIAEFTRA